jgi:hypothetical protein
LWSCTSLSLKWVARVNASGDSPCLIAAPNCQSAASFNLIGLRKATCCRNTDDVKAFEGFAVHLSRRTVAFDDIKEFLFDGRESCLRRVESARIEGYGMSSLFDACTQLVVGSVSFNVEWQIVVGIPTMRMPLKADNDAFEGCDCL